MARQRFNFTMPSLMRQRLDSFLQRTGMNGSDVIRLALDDFLERKEAVKPAAQPEKTHWLFQRRNA